LTRKRVRKAVIPAAGLGTRFLPATKAIPKEMLPIVDKPTIQYIVEEAVASGIEDIIIITGRGKGEIEDHFDYAYELDDTLEQKGKTELLHQSFQAAEMVRLISIRQKRPLGLGHAVLCARSVIGDEPFVVLLGDDIIRSKKPATLQMIEQYNAHGKSLVSIMDVPEDDVSLYGIVAGTRRKDGLLNIEQMIEKPRPAEAPSRSAIIGRYLLTPDVFEFLEQTRPGSGGEIQLTDALDQLRQTSGLLGYFFEGDRYDAGEKFGYLKANIEFALERPELRPKLLDYLRERLRDTESA
jgi:UTP--glucose-1-phosphate uridylyltransferase